MLRVVRALLACSFVLSTSMARAQVVTEMTPEMTRQAIAYGQKEKRLDLHEIKVSSGFAWDSDKVRWGYFSTPFLRVAMAANKAKRQYKPFTEADVTADLIAPELHVYAGAVSLGGMRVANVETVVIMAAGSKDRSTAIQPLRVTELPEEFQNLFGAKVTGRSVLAVFPLDVLSPRNDIHVVFDSRVASGVTGCDDCSMRFRLNGIR